MVASSSAEEQQPRVVALASAKGPQLQRAAVCFGAAMVEDPILMWATDGKNPAGSVAFYTKMAEVFFSAMADRTWCWALEAPPKAQARPGDLDAHTPQSVCLACEVPRSYPSDWQLLRAGMLGLGLRCPSWRCVRMFLYLTPEFQNRHKAFHKAHGPFVYIAAFGTRPKLWGRGRGSQLLSAVLQRADEKDMYCYLEASSDDSRRFYARHGFQLLEELAVLPPAASDAAGAPLLYVMARPPPGATGGGGGGAGGADAKAKAGVEAVAVGGGSGGGAAAGPAVAAAAPAAEVVVTPADGDAVSAEAVAVAVAVQGAAAALAQQQTGQPGERVHQGDDQV
ncbi:hypothetical protein HXX76_004870 [Chlamydomonas incerta]|uniref:N-acetyltransferase domain-containing protein n=1 Tax=Chlamydomonas incerta TaxID=51695 RepID=A0A835T9G3_CHLIN|nr:hypothetical protein HXX76_004870 [Chlamydomonas incerta]|eukprot:KAG2439517.1 hypothetical protein HXX76_004870 [Chlamydomonas incerta]